MYSTITDTEPIPEGAPARLVGILLLCLGIGVFEECLYRGILFGGVLGVTGTSRKGVMIAVVASSVWFGYAHVGVADFSTAGTAAQAILKIVETGMFGIVMCDIVLHTRSLGAAALFHGINDLLFMGASAVLAGSEASSSYTTNESPEAVTYALIAYGLIVAVYLIPTIRSLMRIWKEHTYCQGPFMKQQLQEE